MEQKKRGIVVGCGGMGRGWIRNLRNNPRCEVAALVDLCLDHARRTAEETGVPVDCCYDDVGKAIAVCDADFVADITVPEAHAPVTVTALDAGLPVIGEKPMADTMEAARSMVAAAERSNKLYMVSQSRRYNPVHITTRNMLHTGCIGDITTVTCDFFMGCHFGGFRDEMVSPLILDMAIHHFDLCRFLVNADPVAVYAHEFNPKGSWYEGDVSASVIFEMSDGVVFTYRGSWCAEGCHTSWNGNWRIVGDHGTALMEYDRMPKIERVTDQAQPAFNLELEQVPIEEATPPGDGIAGSLIEFIDALETGRMPQCECHDNIKSLEMVHKAMESACGKQRLVF